MKIKHSFSAQLMKIFLISTLLPFILISTFLAQFYSREYEKDIQSLLNSTASSMTSNMITYLEELEQVTLQPYYSDSLYNYLEKKSRAMNMTFWRRFLSKVTWNPIFGLFAIPAPMSTESLL